MGNIKKLARNVPEVLCVITMATMPVGILVIGIVKGSPIIGLEWGKWITIATGIIMAFVHALCFIFISKAIIQRKNYSNML